MFKIKNKEKTEKATQRNNILLIMEQQFKWHQISEIKEAKKSGNSTFWILPTKNSISNETILQELLNIHLTIHLNCDNKILQNGWLMHNKNLFLTVLEARSPRSGCRYGWVRALFQVTDLSLYPHRTEKGKRAPLWLLL